MRDADAVCDVVAAAVTDGVGDEAIARAKGCRKHEFAAAVAIVVHVAVASTKRARMLPLVLAVEP